MPKLLSLFHTVVTEAMDLLDSADSGFAVPHRLSPKLKDIIHCRVSLNILLGAPCYEYPRMFAQMLW